MISSQCIILEFPSNLGLKEPKPGQEPGVRKMPDWLKQYGFHKQIAASAVHRLEPPPYSMHLDEKTGVRNAEGIISYAKEQATLIQTCLSQSSFLVLLGGDCSILVGTALALKKQGRYGLFFLDGHTDFMPVLLSQTGGAAGMDLSFVTGNGPENMIDIDHCRPYLQEEYVYCVGNRELDSEYVQQVLDSSISYHDLASLRQKGMESIANDFLKMVTDKTLDGFFIHLDVDVLNDVLMPAVDSRTPGGLSYKEFETILFPLLSSPLAIGIEITILDPDLDPDGIYTREFVERFCKLFNRARNS